LVTVGQEPVVLQVPQIEETAAPAEPVQALAHRLAAALVAVEVQVLLLFVIVTLLLQQHQSQLAASASVAQEVVLYIYSTLLGFST
jgi:hypothetical protein